MHIFIIFLVLTCTTTATITTHNRRVLHRPFFPEDTPTLPPAQPPSLPPSLPFLSTPTPSLPFLTTPTTPSDGQPFFPSVPPPPPPPPLQSPTTSSASFPANISALNLPTTPNKHVSSKLIHIVITLSIAAVILFSIFIIFKLIKRKKYHVESQSVTEEKPHRAYNNSMFNAPVNNGGNNYNRIPKLNRPSQTSSEFLYLGTLVNSHGGIDANGTRGSENRGDEGSNLQKVCSPELRPLPPLTGSGGGRSQTLLKHDRFDNTEFEEFYSPGKSVTGNGTDAVTAARRSSSSSYSSTSSGSPARSISLSISPPVSLSPRNTRMKSPELVALQTAPPPSRPAPPPPPPPPSLPPHVGLSKDSLESSPRLSNSSNDLVFSPARIPPPPLTPATRLNPPVLVKPSRPVPLGTQEPVISVSGIHPENQENPEMNEKTRKPKLKPLHWDKVRASSDHEMAWDHLKSGSFKLNEEMIETLFVVKPSTASKFHEKSTTKHPICPTSISHESQVLDPKKSQNVAITLRALNVTSEEVCDALLEGNIGTLGTALLEILLKMAPTKEEERKLKEYRDDSPSKLGPAEKFLKAVLEVPFAFKRVGAMLYVSNFDSEVKYLKLSFQILEVACEELKNNRMFLKLLEAVLKTGNRMNIGTNRGDAQAFNLDTLLKLIDVKGSDGKTTLLHFVVQEITRNAKPGNGLQTVSRIGSDLSNVKKAAAMDSEVLKGDVTRLSNGINSIIEIVKLMESTKFSDSMNGFLKMGQEEVIKIRVQESETLSLVKEITEYFHGNSSAKEDVNCLRIFVVVRDFLTVLDRVCKEVGTVNDQIGVDLVRGFSGPGNGTPVFNGFHGRREYSSSDDESSSSV